MFGSGLLPVDGGLLMVVGKLEPGLLLFTLDGRLLKVLGRVFDSRGALLDCGLPLV